MKYNDLIRRSGAHKCLDDARKVDWQNVDGIGHAYIDRLPAVDAVEVVWLPVVGYEGMYEVSNFGDVRTVDGVSVRQSISRKPNTCYKSVWLKKDGKWKTKYVHRLVAEAFIPNHETHPIVNHKDEDGTNNRVENLEWCTLQYNTNYGTARERQAAKIRGRVSPHAVLVEAFGEKHTRKEWGDMYGIDPHNIEHRMSLGWDAEKAISTPLMKNQYVFRDGRRREDGDA